MVSGRAAQVCRDRELNTTRVHCWIILYVQGPVLYAVLVYYLCYREIAMEILSRQGEGAFIVRESASNPGCYALSLKTPTGKIVHYLIQQDSRGIHFQVRPFAVYCVQLR